MRPSYIHYAFASLAGVLCHALPQAAPTLQPVSEDLFQQFVRYTKFQAASIPPSCPSPPFGSVTIADIENTDTNTQARIFRDNDAMEIILGFPGSNGDDETNHDSAMVNYTAPGINCNACRVHKGYLRAWNSVAEDIRTKIRKALNSHPGFKVIVTGHSLGGALTTLAYASLSEIGMPVKAGYSAGSPRLGNPDFADYIDSISGATNMTPGNFYRLTHLADRVPNSFKIDGGWRHPRTEYWQMGNQTQTAATTYRCPGQENPDCNLGATPKNMEDHALYSTVSFRGNNPANFCNA